MEINLCCSYDNNEHALIRIELYIKKDIKKNRHENIIIKHCNMNKFSYTNNTLF